MMCLFLSVRDATRDSLAAKEENNFRCNSVLGSALSVILFAFMHTISSNGAVVFDMFNFALSTKFAQFAEAGVFALVVSPS